MAKKKTSKKSTNKKVAAKAAAPAHFKFGKADKPRSKTEVYTQIAENTGLAKRDVKQVFDALTAMIGNDLKKTGPQAFNVPGLMKIVVQRKPATKGGKRPNPFKPGEMMEVKPRPARNVVKVRPLKSLKEMV